jgi:hypothetical protein
MLAQSTLLQNKRLASSEGVPAELKNEQQLDKKSAEFQSVALGKSDSLHPLASGQPLFNRDCNGILPDMSPMIMRRAFWS